MSDINPPIYTRRMTVEEMAEESRKATAEGMRQLAAAMLSSKRQVMNPEQLSDFESDSETETKFEKARGRHGVVDNSATVEKLENRVRFLTLDLANAHVAVEEANAKMDSMESKLFVLKRVNDEIMFLKSSINRAFNNTGTMNRVQLENRLNLFLEEANEHATLCNVACSKVELEEIKHGMLRVLVAERKRLKQTEKSFRFLILKTKILEGVLYIGAWSSLLIVLLAILYMVILRFI